MKSIYYTFGAQPHQLHPTWQAAEVISIVRFTVDRVPYSMMKQGGFYTLFNHNGEIEFQSTKVSELSTILAVLFDFKLKLVNQKTEIITPPPAYLFLPYYIDQDLGWAKNWASFDRLYLPNAKGDLISYHTGLKPNEYFEAKGEIKLIDDKVKTLSTEEKIVKGLLANLKEKIAKNEFIVNIEEFQKEISELLLVCEQVNSDQNKIKHKLAHDYNTKASIESQLQITRRALEETQDDYNYATDVLEDFVECPSCGAEYKNSFAERFEMAQDEKKCIDLITELKEELETVDASIKETSTLFSSNNFLIVDIEKRLGAKKEEVKLRDLIASEGKREIKNMLIEEVEQYTKRLKNVLVEKKRYEDTIKELDDKERKEAINEKYLRYMSTFLKGLNVRSLQEKFYKSMSSTIKESGSAKPRALMAYYYSILHLVREYGSSAFCPIVIDAPNQQGQDKENLPLMLKFIIDNQPKNTQLILAIEETHDIDFGAQMVTLTHKSRLLDPEQFDTVSERMHPFLIRAAQYSQAQ
ncbi:hypothetical protein I5L79_19515 [Hymenobacter sp. BT594]|uniref:Uncharacterized protein n=2 Tax=Hymenobacter guriensis TaxID=2793065 RepID=A0ABS0L6K2_9BACT|nr:hypothetical protein [Hymenobacter guriensis]